MKSSQLTRIVNQRGLKYWSINCFKFYLQKYLLRFFYRRDKKLWVFSAWEGTKYSDNTRYLFEYMLENEPDIQCIWMTQNEKLYHSLLDKGIPVSLIGTSDAKRIQRRAGVAIYTNGLDDFGHAPDIFGAKLVCLWHGIGIKHNYATQEHYRGNLFNKLAILKQKLFSFIDRDMTISSSIYVSQLYRKESMTKKPIYVVGQPRNDVLADSNVPLNKVFESEFIHRFHLAEDEILITYMPTYRSTPYSQRMLEKLVEDLIINEELNTFLREHNVKLLIKTHYATDTSGMQFNENIVLIDDKMIECTQKLLCKTDLLITDYSTCVIDYALLERPILLFMPDFEEYCEDKGLYEEFIDITKDYMIRQPEELVVEIQNWYQHREKKCELASRINQLYNERASEVGHYSEYTAQLIRQQFKIGRDSRKYTKN